MLLLLHVCTLSPPACPQAPSLGTALIPDFVIDRDSMRAHASVVPMAMKMLLRWLRLREWYHLFLGVMRRSALVRRVLGSAWREGLIQR